MYRFLRFPNFRCKAVTLSYDDGLVFDRRLINILDEYGLKCTFNLNSESYPKEKGICLRLTKDEATELFLNSPHEVAIHGANHISLATVGPEAVMRDVIIDRQNLEKQFGRIIKGLAYASGSFNDDVVEVLKNCGINYARTIISSNKFNLPIDWLRLMPTCRHCADNFDALTDEFLSLEEGNPNHNNPPKLFYLWGHTFEFNDSNNWEVIENFAKKVGNRNDIWYCTNGELYDYVKAYKQLEYSFDGTILKNGTDTDVYLCYYGQRILIKAGEILRF